MSSGLFGKPGFFLKTSPKKAKQTSLNTWRIISIRLLGYTKYYCEAAKALLVCSFN